jgi:hypothetical protein
MAERQLPGGRAAKGRRLADFRPMPRGPAGIVVVDDGVVPERDEPETVEPPPQRRRTGRRTPPPETPDASRLEAAGQAAAATMAVPLLAQFGQALLASGQLDPKLVTEHHRRQQLALRKLRRTLLRLQGARPEPSDGPARQRLLFRMARTCYDLASESLQAQQALLLPVLRTTSARPLTITHPPRPRIIDLDPASPPARALLDAGRVAAGETDPEMQRVTVVNDDDMTVVVDPHPDDTRVEEPA